MNDAPTIIFFVISMIVAVVNVAFGINSFRKRKRVSTIMGITCILASCATFSYLLSISNDVESHYRFAVNHCHSNLVVILGHTHCGAVHAALSGCKEEHIHTLTDQIIENVGDIKDETLASKANAKKTAENVYLNVKAGTLVVPALFDIETGVVEFLD